MDTFERRWEVGQRAAYVLPGGQVQVLGIVVQGVFQILSFLSLVPASRSIPLIARALDANNTHKPGCWIFS